MPFDFSAADDRVNQTIHAAGIFHDNARVIATCCADATEHELVVAGVTHDHAFQGVWTIPRFRLADHVEHVDDGGWTLIFSSGCSLGDIEERCITLGRDAFARWEALRHWASRHR